MRLISFSMTTEAFQRREKTVTRRLGWTDLKAGDVLMGCVKCMGLKKGEKVERLHAIRVVRVSWEPLHEIRRYGRAELLREGFPDMSAGRFIAMFCDYNKCDAHTIVTRIEFEHLEDVEASS